MQRLSAILLILSFAGIAFARYYLSSSLRYASRYGLFWQLSSEWPLSHTVSCCMQQNDAEVVPDSKLDYSLV